MKFYVNFRRRLPSAQENKPEREKVHDPDKKIDERKIYVSKLDRDTDEDGLFGYFSLHGKVRRAHVPVDKFTGESRRFGFVYFEEPESVQKVLNEEHCLDGEFIKVEQAYEDKIQPEMFSPDPDRKIDERKIYVSKLDRDTDEDGLFGM